MSRLCTCKISESQDIFQGLTEKLRTPKKIQNNYMKLELSGETQNIIIMFSEFISSLERQKNRGSHIFSFLSDWNIWEPLWLRGRKAGQPMDSFYWHLLVFHFLFSKGFDLFTQIIHLLSLLFTSCDNPTGTEWLSLSHLLCGFSLLSVWK